MTIFYSCRNTPIRLVSADQSYWFIATAIKVSRGYESQAELFLENFGDPGHSAAD